MKNPNKLNALFLVLIFFTLFCDLLTQTSCIIIKDSPAPGCVKRVGFPMSGGCFGKSAILGLRIEPNRNDIILQVNNCNGGVLEVRNTSDQLLVLGGVEIETSGYTALDVRERQSDGFYSLKEISSNFSEYVPQQDEVIKVHGILGKEQLVVTYTKTKKLCD
jgi:hypothetical protein